MTSLSEHRRGRITGSRVAAVLGLSPWQSSDQLLRAMVREYHGVDSEFTGNIATEWGKTHETEAILAFQKITGLHVSKTGFHMLGDIMGATPDGLTSDNAVLEVKVPFGLRNQYPAQFKTLKEQPHYLAQLQMELAATGRDKAYFFQYVPANIKTNQEEQYKLEEVDYDPHWMATHRNTLVAFHRRYKEELDNEAHLEPLRAVLDTDEAQALVDEIDRLRAKERAAKAGARQALASLVKLAGERDASIKGRKLTKAKDGVTISYAEIVKTFLNPNLDFDAFTKTRPGSWRLSAAPKK